MDLCTNLKLFIMVYKYHFNTYMVFQYYVVIDFVKNTYNRIIVTSNSSY